MKRIKMNIHIKKCGKCGKEYDYPECPYCNWTEEQIKKEGENEKRVG